MNQKNQVRLIAAAVACVAAIVVTLLRPLSLLVGLELRAYDLFLSFRASEPPAASPIVLAVYDEALLNDVDFVPHPVPDAVLATLFGRLCDAGAAVVAVDIWRGSPVPKEITDSPLDALLLERENIVMVRDLAGDSPTRAAPAAIAGDNRRVGVANFPFDPELGTVVRRGYLTADDEEGTWLSLPFLAALRYLSAAEGHALELVAAGRDETHYRIADTIFRPFRSSDGPYARAEDHGFQVMIDFASDGAYPERSFRWVLESDDAELKRFAEGKVVFAGVTAQSVKDSIATPLDPDHRGLHLHALFADQLIGAALDRRYRQLRFPGDTAESFIVLAWALLGALPALFLRRVPARLAVLAAGLALAGILFIGLLSVRIWIPVVAPMLAFGLALAGATAASEFHQRRTASQLEVLFRRHLGEKQFALVWGEREVLLREGRIPSRQLEATIVMTDLRGYTTVSEKLAGDTLLSWLNRIHATMETAVVDHHGMVKSIIGDAIYAVFGLPQSDYRGREGSERQREEALKCALDMAQRIAKLNEAFASEGLPEASMRIGINTGTVTVGTLGSEKGMEYGIIGDVVNTAARLESYDKGSVTEGEACRVIAGESTLAGVAGRFEVEDIGALHLKGKARKIRAFRVISARSPS